jgi:hypothetical protein
MVIKPIGRMTLKATLGQNDPKPSYRVPLAKGTHMGLLGFVMINRFGNRNLRGYMRGHA